MARTVTYNDDDFVEVGLGERRNVFTWQQPRSGGKGYQVGRLAIDVLITRG